MASMMPGVVSVMVRTMIVAGCLAGRQLLHAEGGGEAFAQVVGCLGEQSGGVG